jgi:hypothetical protein
VNRPGTALAAPYILRQPPPLCDGRDSPFWFWRMEATFCRTAGSLWTRKAQGVMVGGPGDAGLGHTAGKVVGPTERLSTPHRPVDRSMSHQGEGAGQQSIGSVR